MIYCESTLILEEPQAVFLSVDSASSCISLSLETNPVELCLVNPPVVDVSIESSPIYELTMSPVAACSGGSSPVNGWANFGQSTPKQVQVTSTSTLLLSSNTARVYVKISNNSSQLVYIQYGINAVWKQGTPLAVNQTLIIGTTELFKGSIYAIALTGSVFIDVMEGVP